MTMLPVAVYGLKVPAGNVMIPTTMEFPATVRITMAAIDPSAEPEYSDDEGEKKMPPRATLKMVFDPSGPEEDDSDDEDDEDEDAYLQALLDGEESDGLSDEEDEEEEEETKPNGKPQSKKERKEAATKQLIEALSKEASDDDDDEDEEMDVDPALKKAGAKEKSLAEEEDSEDEELEDEDSIDGMEEVVVCTLDPEKTHQQTVDITIPEDQPTYFKVSGTHAIYLTGNYVIPADEPEHDDEQDYDLSPDEDELDMLEDDESDDLDDLEDPRITEVDSEDEEEEEAPALVSKKTKGKNKRAAAESDEEQGLDEMIAEASKPAEEPKLSKKQMKKLKANTGKAVEAAIENKEVKKDEPKKVQFAKNIEQGPTGSPAVAKAAETKQGDKPKASLGVKTVQGVKIDDKKLGKGPAAKKGDKLGMRYIGKLSNGKVFDANKKGPPFRFKLGAGEVIKGWDIGVAGMSVEGERRITIPASLGYGAKGTPGIPGNSELTFDIKLLEIK